LLLLQLDACVFDFEHLKCLYADDNDLVKLYSVCPKHPKGDFLSQEGFLLKGTCLCVSKCSTHELLIKEVYEGSFAGHYGENKTITILREHYY